MLLVKFTIRVIFTANRKMRRFSGFPACSIYSDVPIDGVIVIVIIVITVIILIVIIIIVIIVIMSNFGSIATVFFKGENIKILINSNTLLL